MRNKDSTVGFPRVKCTAFKEFIKFQYFPQFILIYIYIYSDQNKILGVVIRIEIPEMSHSCALFPVISTKKLQYLFDLVQY